MAIFSNEQSSIMHEKLSQAIKDFSYRFRRYEINYSIAISYSPENIDLTPLSRNIRESDRFIILDQHTCAVILDCANDTSGMKAANNLLTHFQASFFSMKLFVGIVTASNYESDPKMLNELFFLLDYAIERNMNNIIVESSQVIEKH